MFVNYILGNFLDFNQISTLDWFFFFFFKYYFSFVKIFHIRFSFARFLWGNPKALKGSQEYYTLFLSSLVFPPRFFFSKILTRHIFCKRSSKRGSCKSIICYKCISPTLTKTLNLLLISLGLYCVCSLNTCL